MRLSRLLLLLPLVAICAACSADPANSDRGDAHDLEAERPPLKTPTNVPASENAAPAHKPVAPDSLE